MAGDGHPQIIDLTNDNEQDDAQIPINVNSTKDEPMVINIDSDPEPGEITQPTTPFTKKQRRKKKKKKSIVGDVREAEDDKGEGPSTTRLKEEKEITPDASNLFFVDLDPALLPAASQHDNNVKKKGIVEHGEEETKLLLPSHVQVFGSMPVEIIPATAEEGEDEDYIDYLDFESNRKGIARYYEDEEEKPAKTRHVCKNCGAEGDHTSAKCPVLICLTCGARNEHVTRSCPINKTCFTCGMKGHLSSTCPNRRNVPSGGFGYICQRCGSDTHSDTECPTLWRIYEYVAEDEREKTINRRLSQASLELGKGGEGYIAQDSWCYNCGQSGHWGDDCTSPKPYGVPEEGSAFHWRNVTSGPFAEVQNTSAPSPARRDFRDWERDDHFLGEVGKAGKQKAKQRMAKNESKREEEPNWFDSQAQKRKDNGNERPGGGGKKLAFGASIGKHFIPQPALAARIQEGPTARRDRERDRERDRGYDAKGKHWDRSRDKDRGRDDYKRKRQEEPYETDSRRKRHRDSRDSREYPRYPDRGPRYSGGYAR